MIRKLEGKLKYVSGSMIAAMMVITVAGCTAGNVKAETTEAATEAAVVTEAETEAETEAVTQEVTEDATIEEATEADKAKTNEAALDFVPANDGKTHIYEQDGGDYCRVEFSGNKDEIVTFDKHTFYEGDDFYLFFQKGTEVPGDAADVVDKVMADLESVEHMKYSDGESDGDSYWRTYYFDEEFDDINRDCSKINIFVLDNPNDGRVECATVNECLVYDEDFTETEEAGSESTIYHEMAHVLRLRQSPNLGGIMEEGVAVYSEYEMMKRRGRQEYSLMQYMDSFGLYDSEKIIENPEKVFYEITKGEHDDTYEQTYQYGFRFVCFLYEEYGEDVVKNISEIASKTKYDDYDIDPSILMGIIKMGTSDDVFERFGKWLPEAWEKKEAEYRELMGQKAIDF